MASLIYNSRLQALALKNLLLMPKHVQVNDR